MRCPSAPLLALVLLLLLPPAALGQTAPEARGIWIHENHFSDLDATFLGLSEAGINIAYLRTWYQGRTVYPSDVVENAGGVRQHSAFVGRDPIKEAIDIAEQYGISVAVWMEYGLVAQTAYASGEECPAPTGVLAQNPDWSMRDRSGAIATPSSGAGSLCFYWMDPAHPEVVDFMADMAAEIALRYPALDIYEADRFRYPSYDWSYSDISVERYIDETGNTDPRTTQANDADYIAWRRAQTTHLMGEVYRTVKENNPSMAVSAAVVPPYMIGGSQDKMQYWPAWADSGYVDFLEIMLYLPDTAYPNQLNLARGLVNDAFPIYGGIDNSQSYDLVGQIEETRRQSVEGVIIWDGRDALSTADRELLGSGIFSEQVQPPHDDIRVDDDEAQLEGSWNLIDTGYGGSARELPSGSSASATYALSPVREGWYALDGWWPSFESAIGLSIITVTSNVEGGEMPLVAEVNQREGEEWKHIHVAHLRHGDTLFVEVAPGEVGAAVADAFRLRRTYDFRLTDALITGETTVQLRFNRAIDQDFLSSAQISIGTVATESVGVKSGDPSVLLIETSPMTSGATYEVSISNLYSENGLPLAPVSLELTASLEQSTIILDDDESGFNQQGKWTEEAAGGYNDEGFRHALAGAANRAFWIKATPEDALYAVSVYLPEGGEHLTTSATYFVIHRDGTDTVHVDQRNHPGGWHELGVYRPRNNSQLYVQLYGDASAEGTIVADAVRWRRTLSPVDAPLDTPTLEMAVGAPYPNPTRGLVHIPIIAPPAAEIFATVHDALGRQITTKRLSAAAPPSLLTLDLSSFASGTYFIRARVVAPDGRQEFVTKRIAVVR